MANIVLKTFAAGDEGQGTVTPQDDALIYQNAVSVNGIFGGATVTLTGANTLHVASGFGIICGRFFEINESDISVQLSSSGTLNGRLKIHLDLNNADNPIEIVTETGASLPVLSGDPNININGGAFDMELCTFSVNELSISSLVNTFPTIDNTSKQVRRKTAYAVNDFVLCQSASDALIFICTVAGTTAVQEPTAYATVTDGNTVTDGTAVFKAVGLMAEITRNQQLLAPVLTSLVAPAGGLSTGEQFIYNGLLYKATAAIAQGGTIVINGNCTLADSVTEQIFNLFESDFDSTRKHGYIKIIDGTLIQYGVDTIPSNGAYVSITYLKEFSTNNYGFSAVFTYNYANNVIVSVSSKTKTGISVYRDTTNASAQTLQWIAIGRWK